MALTAPAFLRPPPEENTGRLSLALFPGYTAETLTTFIEALLVAAYANPTIAALSGAAQDEAARSYVYREAYDEALSLSITRASEIRLDNLGTKKLDIRGLREQLRIWRDQYSDALDTATSSGTSRFKSVQVSMEAGR